MTSEYQTSKDTFQSIVSPGSVRPAHTSYTAIRSQSIREARLGIAIVGEVCWLETCHGSDQIKHVASLIGHVTSLSVTLSERVLVSPKSCALLDFLSLLFSLEFS
jgi:hypothetical protein